MGNIIIRNAKIINRGAINEGDIFIKNGRIEQIAGSIDKNAKIELDANGKYAMPGIIDDQVHFREPGLTHKATIYSESRAAIAGGVTSFMEMPNTKPAALTQKLLQDKYDIAAKNSLTNYSFFMGAANDNLEEVLKTNSGNVCGIKAFMGSSTGNMLVDDPLTLEGLFKRVNMLIATHCEDETTIRNNMEIFRQKYGENVPIDMHPVIRNVEACLKSSSLAIELAKKHNTRLHILHISTKDELDLFTNEIPLKEKRITAEVCVHHLFFNRDDYKKLGAAIKCNPAIKEKEHQEALFSALLDNRLDIIATDHAPHSWEEKQGTYFNAPSGLPLVQHSLNIMLGFYKNDRISLERIVEKMCHAPSICFEVDKRGFLDEGYWADVVLFDTEVTSKVEKSNIHYKCAWSPLETMDIQGRVEQVIVSGHLAYSNGRFIEGKTGKRLLFDRE